MEERDPLDELRESIDVAAKGTSLLISRKRLKSYADAWQAERTKHDDDMRLLLARAKTCDTTTEYARDSRDHWEKVSDELQAKLDAAESDNAALRTEYVYLSDCLKARTAQRDELQAKLDASMFVPLDADGVPCRIGDEMLDGGSDKFTVLAVGNDCLRSGDYFYVARMCRHVSPKPETIEDVRERACMANQRMEFIDSAYECGRRDGAEADISGHCPKSNGTRPDGGSDD